LSIITSINSYPSIGEEKAISITTKVTIAPQNRVCEETADKCDGKVFKATGEKNETFFLVGIEEYNVSNTGF
jgi:hypothetical protein